MEKSKLFEDVHVSAPTAHKPVSVLGPTTSFTNLPLQSAQKSHRSGMIFFAGGALCLVAAMAFSLSSGLTSRPKVVLVKAPALTTQTVTVQSQPSAQYGVDWPAVSAAAASQPRVTTLAPAIPQASTISALESEISRLRTVNSTQQAQVDMLNSQIKRLTAVTAPLASTAPAVPNTFAPVSLDQHGVVLTVNGRAFQCASREGSPVCISIGGYPSQPVRRRY
jgi:hypothetical protein